MSFVPAAAVAHVMGSVRRFESVRTRDHLEAVVFCVMGLSSVELVQGCGTEILAMSAIRGEERPEYLRRARGSISGATLVGNEVPECLRTFPHNHDLRCEI